MPNSTQPSPKRGEIWQVNFDPQVGSEIQKNRPAMVLDQGYSALPVRVVVPITSWKQARDEQNPFRVHLMPTASNGLTKECAADAYQIKTVALQRFLHRLGAESESQTDAVAEAVALVTDLPGVED